TRTELIEELEFSFSDVSKQTNVVLNACAGLGGVGKTQLALYYFYHSKRDYSVRCWIPAEKVDLIVQQYTPFGIQLGILSTSSTNLEEQAQQMKQWFEQRSNWLIVFDNAENPSLLQDWIPHTGKGGHILITSRNLNWQVHNKI